MDDNCIPESQIQNTDLSRFFVVSKQQHQLIFLSTSGPFTVLSVLHVFNHLIFIIFLKKKYYLILHLRQNKYKVMKQLFKVTEIEKHCSSPKTGLETLILCRTHGNLTTPWQSVHVFRRMNVPCWAPRCQCWFQTPSPTSTWWYNQIYISPTQGKMTVQN